MSHIKVALKQLLQGIQVTEAGIASVGLFICTTLIFVQVVNRFWLHFEIMGIGDLALYIFILFMFFAAAVTTYKEGHLAVDYFREKALAKRPRGTAIYRVCIVVISIALMYFLLPVAYEFMLRAIKYPEYGTLVRWFNTGWLMISFFVALVLVLIHLLVIAVRDVGHLREIHPRSKR